MLEGCVAGRRSSVAANASHDGLPFSFNPNIGSFIHAAGYVPYRSVLASLRRILRPPARRFAPHRAQYIESVTGSHEFRHVGAAVRGGILPAGSSLWGGCRMHLNRER